jgi:hypothetical protein
MNTDPIRLYIRRIRLDKIGIGSRPGAPTTTTVAGVPEEPVATSQQPAVSEQPKADNPAGTARQEASSRLKETALQANVRKDDLLNQVDQKPKETQAKFVERNLPSEAALRETLTKKTFPAVLEGLKKGGFKNDKETCNIAAGMLLNALKHQGITGAKIRETPLHTYVEVPTKKGTLILDPTASQFFKEGSPAHSRLKQEGFIGTRKELEKMIAGNLEHWKFGPGIGPDPKALAVTRGGRNPEVHAYEADQHVNEFQEEAESRYFSGRETKLQHPAAHTSDKLKQMKENLGPEGSWFLGSQAQKQAEWYDRGDLDEPFYNSFNSNMTEPLKKAYEAMEQKLQE